MTTVSDIFLQQTRALLDIVGSAGDTARKSLPDPGPSSGRAMLSLLRQVVEEIPPLTAELDVFVEELNAKRMSIQAMEAELAALDHQNRGPRTIPCTGPALEPPEGPTAALLDRRAAADLIGTARLTSVPRGGSGTGTPLPGPQGLITRSIKTPRSKQNRRLHSLAGTARVTSSPAER